MGLGGSFSGSGEGASLDNLITLLSSEEAVSLRVKELKDAEQAALKAVELVGVSEQIPALLDAAKQDREVAKTLLDNAVNETLALRAEADASIKASLDAAQERLAALTKLSAEAEASIDRSRADADAIKAEATVTSNAMLSAAQAREAAVSAREAAVSAREATVSATEEDVLSRKATLDGKLSAINEIWTGTV